MGQHHSVLLLWGSAGPRIISTAGRSFLLPTSTTTTKINVFLSPALLVLFRFQTVIGERPTVEHCFLFSEIYALIMSLMALAIRRFRRIKVMQGRCRVHNLKPQDRITLDVFTLPNMPYARLFPGMVRAFTLPEVYRRLELAPQFTL